MRDAKGDVDGFSVLKIYGMLSVLKTGISRQSLNLRYLQILLVCQFPSKAHRSLIFIGRYLAVVFVKHQPSKPVSLLLSIIRQLSLYN